MLLHYTDNGGIQFDMLAFTCLMVRVPFLFLLFQDWRYFSGA